VIDVKPVEWGAALSVGVASIDREHCELLDIINLIAAEIAERPGSCPESLVNQLATSTRAHFRSEEMLLERHGYPDLAIHHAEHEQLMQRITLFVELCGRREATPRVVELLGEWFVEHVFNHDMPYRSFLAERSAE